MKKILFALVVCLFFIQGHAQYSNRSFYKGIKAGYINSRISNLENNSKSSFYIGLQAPIVYNEIFSFQPEAVYSRRGARNIEIAGITENQTSASKKVDLNLGYVDFNLISKLSYDIYSIHVGPGASVLVHSSDKKAGVMEVTLNFGAGVQISPDMGIELRWTVGSGDIGISNQENVTTGSQYLQIGTYYNF
ncbi:MAG: PorT family protein [Flavobacteriaceae bacterium]|jgi:hypothetical protein|nr:PorT family protein [Flavobacteriaceae bacterium]